LAFSRRTFQSMDFRLEILILHEDLNCEWPVVRREIFLIGHVRTQPLNPVQSISFGLVLNPLRVRISTRLLTDKSEPAFGWTLEEGFK